MQLGRLTEELADAANRYIGEMRVPIFAEELSWNFNTQFFAIERVESGWSKPGIE
jgi:hypothetical protein